MLRFSPSFCSSRASIIFFFHCCKNLLIFIPSPASSLLELTTKTFTMSFTYSHRLPPPLPVSFGSVAIDYESFNDFFFLGSKAKKLSDTIVFLCGQNQNRLILIGNFSLLLLFSLPKRNTRNSINVSVYFDCLFLVFFSSPKFRLIENNCSMLN